MKAVNLLPDRYRRSVATGARKGSAYLVVGTLGVLLAAVAVYVFTANQAGARQDDAARAAAEAQVAEAKAASLGSFSNFAQIKQTRLASVSALAAMRFDWERFMRELARVLPAGVSLTDVEASVGPASSSSTGSGSGSSTAAAGGSGGDAAVAPTARLTGCARSHRAVAALLVRLRALHRSSDVTLEKSARRGADEGASAPVSQTGPAPAGGEEGCGKGFGFDAVVTFDPKDAPAADRVGKVPASLGGGS